MMETKGKIATCPRPYDITEKNYSDACYNSTEYFIQDCWSRSIAVGKGDGAQLWIQGRVGI